MKRKTLRNQQMVRMYMLGVPIKVIAHYFSVSETVVKKYAHRIGVRRRPCLNNRSTSRQLELPLIFSRKTSSSLNDATNIIKSLSEIPSEPTATTLDT